MSVGLNFECFKLTCALRLAEADRKQERWTSVGVKINRGITPLIGHE